MGKKKVYKPLGEEQGKKYCMSRYECAVKVDVKELTCEYVNWIQLAQKGIQRDMHL